MMQECGALFPLARPYRVREETQLERGKFNQSVWASPTAGDSQ
ncbi:hypothetical protein ACNKHW_20565 [Shigella flexneri]